MAKKIGIEIEVDSKGAVTSLKQLGKSGEEATNKISKGSKEATKSLNLLATVGIAGAIAGTIKLGTGVIKLTDQYSLLRSQMRLVIDEGGNLDSVQRKLLETANETRQSFAATVTLYARLDRATEQLFLTDQKVIDATETLNKAIIISGASAQEAEASIIQLSQGLASGALRGDELRSVLEQVPRVARLIADGLGVSVGALRELGTQGELTTAKIIGAIQDQTIAINEEFQTIEKTSSQTWTILTNNAESYVTQLGVVKSAQEAFNSVLAGVSVLFESQNKFDAIQKAKETDIQNRSLEQQFMVLSDIKRLQEFDLGFSKEKTGELLKERIEAELGIITVRKRIKAEEDLRKAKGLEAIRVAEQSGLDELEKTANERNQLADAKLQEQIANENIRNDERREREAQAEFEFLEKEAEDEINFQKKIFLEQQEFEAKKGALRSRASQNEKDIAKSTSDFKRGLNEGDARVAIDSFRTIFGESKALASAEIILSTAIGIQKSFELLPPFDFIRASIVGASGVAQLAKVNGAKFADGTEYVQGAGTNRSDSVPAMLSRGERVVDAQTNAQLGGVSNSDLLSAVNGNGGHTYITINAGIGSDPNKIAQAIENYRGISKDRNQRPEPII